MTTSKVTAEMIEAAYREGWRDSENSCNGFFCVQEGESWERSKARTAMQSTQPEAPLMDTRKRIARALRDCDEEAAGQGRDRATYGELTNAALAALTNQETGR